MKDVAEQAGVSVSTVSLVLNSRDEGRITPEVAERVRRVADDLGYVPNLNARGLRTRQTRTIGLLSDQVASTPFAGKMLAAAQREALEAGYLLLLIDTGGSAELESEAVTALLQRNIEGLIYASMFHRVVPQPKLPPRMPFVVLDGRPESEGLADWIVPDEVGGARAAVEALLRAGHRRIGFCNNAEDIPASAGRLEGYLSAHRDAQVPIDESLITAAAVSTTTDGYPAGRRLLERPDRPTAIFCFNDRIAMGVYHAAADLGLSIPTDLSVVGFDDQEFIADSVRPGLTTVRLPHEEMGSWAVRRVVERLRSGSDPRADLVHEIAACQLVERSSVAPPGQ